MIILVFKKFIHNSHKQRSLPDAPLFTTSSRRHSRKNINFHRIDDRSLTPPSSSPPPTTHGAFVTINMRRSIHFSMHLFHQFLRKQAKSCQLLGTNRVSPMREGFWVHRVSFGYKSCQPDARGILGASCQLWVQIVSARCERKICQADTICTQKLTRFVTQNEARGIPEPTDFVGL
jgi:hypothetical protein